MDWCPHMDCETTPPPKKVCERVITKVLCKLFQRFLGLTRGVELHRHEQAADWFDMFLSSERALEGCFIYHGFCGCSCLVHWLLLFLLWIHGRRVRTSSTNSEIKGRTRIGTTQRKRKGT